MARSPVLPALAGIFVLLACPLPLRAQCQPGQACDQGRFAGPWEWSHNVCSDYACSHGGPLEFYHGAVLALGLHAGKVVLTRVDVDANCNDTNSLQTWLFDPASPATLIHIRHAYVPGSQNCAGNALDFLGRLVMVGGPPDASNPSLPNEKVHRLDPTSLGVVEYPEIQYPPPPGPSCTSPFITANAWQAIGDLSLGRYYPTAVPLTREPIEHPGCTDGIAGAMVALGGPPNAVGNQGNEVWELLDPSTGAWACPLVPEGYPGSFPTSEEYARKPDTNKPNPLMDSYPRGFQLSWAAQRQVFVAGDTRTDLDGKPPATVYGSSLTGKEAWTMKIPYADLDDPQLDWELWRTPAMQIEHDYANAVLLFRKSGPALVQNRVLLIGGGQYGSPGPSSLDSVTNVVREFIPGSDASGGTWKDDKTPLAYARYTSSSVLLPDGTILVVGGSKGPTIPGAGIFPEPVYQPEIYDPGDSPTSPGSTRLMALSNFASWGPGTRVPRLYHSMAFLLPDGRIFLVGGRIYQDPAAPLSDSRLSGELFYPPYLFEGDQLAARPTIDGLALSNPSFQQLSTQAQVQSFAVDVTTAAGPVAKVTAIRVSSQTHHFDSDQRFLELDHTGGTSSGSSTLTVAAPYEDMAPQGYYMVFILEQKPDGRLIPSVARFVRFA